MTINGFLLKREVGANCHELHVLVYLEISMCSTSDDIAHWSGELVVHPDNSKDWRFALTDLPNNQRCRYRAAPGLLERIKFDVQQLKTPRNLIREIN
jgi:hypothetical protein